MNKAKDTKSSINILVRVAKFILPFKKLLFLQIFLNTIFSFFSTLSVTLILPILELIFGSNNNRTIVNTGNPLKDLSNNFFQFIFSLVYSDKGTIDTLFNISILIITVFTFKNIFKYLGAVVSTRLEEGVIKSIRDNIFTRLVNLSLDYFTAARQGNLISIITNDVATLNSTTLNSFTTVIREFIQVLLFLFLLLSISPLLTFAAFSTSIISIFLIRLAVKFLRRYAERMQIAMADYTSTMNETIGGIRVVKAFNNENSSIDKFKKDTNKYVISAIKHKKIIEIIPSINELFAIIALCVVLFIGGSQVLNNELQPEKLMLFLFSLFSIMSPISTIFNSLSKFQHGIVAAERIFSIIDKEPSVKSGSKKINSFNNKITIENLDFAYKDDLVLNNINIEIPKGKKIALVGASGSGKSTLLDLIIRFFEPTRGTIYLDGIDIKEFDINSYRNLFGIVSQESILFNDTIANNISFGINASKEEIINASKQANAYKFIANLPNGFDTKIGDRGVTLSGGERQRIAIARAILRNPDILLFDEATSALDSENEKIVQLAIEQNLKDKTAIIVAHRLATIIDCDEIFVFDNGKIVEKGTHTELLKTDGIYAKLYNIQYGKA